MARTLAELPKGARITDYLSLGVLAKTCRTDRIHAALAATERTSRGQRELPAHVVVYDVIALALYMQVSDREVLRCLLEGLQWIAGPTRVVQVTGKSGISQARTRLGWRPLQQLHDEVVRLIAVKATQGAWSRDWRLLSLDGSTLDVADTAGNVKGFGRPGASRGRTAYPQLRFVSLVEHGTHVLVGSHLGRYRDGETTLATKVVAALGPGMVCLADRQFFGGDLWAQARGTGADLLWRVKKNTRLPGLERWPDGSYRSVISPSERDRRHGTNGLTVRVIEYTLAGVTEAEDLYRLVTTIVDPERAPASELAALYHERWEIETALDELTTHVRGAKIVLRSKTPDLVRQEFYGVLLAHFAIRGLMHEAALTVDAAPDRVSDVHAVRVIRRKLPLAVALPPSGASGLP